MKILILVPMNKSNSLICIIIFFIPTLFFAQQRARDPWVFRSVLDETPRALTFALNKELWAAYDTEKCMLVKLWKGGIDFRGEVYTSEKKYQPTVTGIVFFSEMERQGDWMVFENNSWTKASMQFKSYIIENKSAFMVYELIASSGSKIIIEEYPEFSQENGIQAFRRTFQIVSNPENIKVVLNCYLVEMPSFAGYKTNSTLEIKEKTEKLNSGGTNSYFINAHLSISPQKATVLINYIQ